MNSNITIQDMLDMQRRLFNEYGADFGWLTYTPNNAQLHWLYMLGEAGEVVDAMKKGGTERLMQPGDARDHMVEEMADTMMFFMCTMACMGVSAEEFSAKYIEKHERNMKRWKK